MNRNDLDFKINNEEDFVFLKRFNFSIKKTLERYPEGVPDHIIANGLLISEKELKIFYDSIVRKLQSIMKVK